MCSLLTNDIKMISQYFSLSSYFHLLDSLQLTEIRLKSAGSWFLSVFFLIFITKSETLKWPGCFNCDKFKPSQALKTSVCMSDVTAVLILSSRGRLQKAGLTNSESKEDTLNKPIQLCDTQDFQFQNINQVTQLRPDQWSDSPWQQRKKISLKSTFLTSGVRHFNNDIRRISKHI